MHDTSFQLFIEKKYGIKFMSQTLLDICLKMCISGEGKIEKSVFCWDSRNAILVQMPCILPGQMEYRVIFLFIFSISFLFYFYFILCLMKCFCLLFVCDKIKINSDFFY